MCLSCGGWIQDWIADSEVVHIKYDWSVGKREAVLFKSKKIGGQGGQIIETGFGISLST
jgi:hypothetical protein